MSAHKLYYIFVSMCWYPWNVRSMQDVGTKYENGPGPIDGIKHWVLIVLNT
jgi:hypothetical protein